MQSSRELQRKVVVKRQQEVAPATVERVILPTQRHPFMKTETEKQQLREHKKNYFSKLHSLVGTKRPTAGRLRLAISNL